VQDTIYTFAEVQHESRRIAHYFASCGIGKGSVVALYMLNTAEFPIVWLALSRLGCVTAWINFNLRSTVLGHSVDIAKADAIIVSQELQEGAACITI